MSHEYYDHDWNGYDSDYDEDVFTAPVGDQFQGISDIYSIPPIAKSNIEAIKNRGKLFCERFSLFEFSETLFDDSVSLEEFASIIFDPKTETEKENDLENVIDVVYDDILESGTDFRDNKITQSSLVPALDCLDDIIVKESMTINFTPIDEDDFFAEEIDQLINQRGINPKSIEQCSTITDDTWFIHDVLHSALRKFSDTVIKQNEISPHLVQLLSDSELLNCLRYDDKKFSASSDLVRRIRIVYIPSGGGKTTLASDHNVFFDVDDIVGSTYSLFVKITNFARNYPSSKQSIMNTYFKYVISNLSDDILMNRIILLNHPNQVPNVFKFRRNELVILPKSLNIRIRFFIENFCSLLLLDGFVKLSLDYSEYLLAIMRYFDLSDAQISM